MNRIYVTNRKAYDSDSFIKKLAVEQFHYPNPIILRTEHGKPYFLQVDDCTPLHFSISHTDDLLFAVFSSSPIGLDVENIERNVDYTKWIARIESNFLAQSLEEFLQLWTAKESVVKFLGESLATCAKHIACPPAHSQVFFCDKPLPVYVTHLFYEQYLVAVCATEEKVYQFCWID